MAAFFFLKYSLIGYEFFFSAYYPLIMETKITNKPIPGDVLSVNRGLYRHYGVYVGNNTVVHFAGDKDFEISPKHAFIQKTSLEDFSKRNEVQTETRCGESFSRKETVMRALNAVGSERGKYALPWNNCEHFANWCRYGKKRSAQVEHVLGGVATVAAIAIGAVVFNQIKDDLEDFI